MDELKKAVELIEYYNNMEFDEFLTKFETDTNIKVSEEERDGWRFVGLNNIDFYTMHINN